MEPATRDDLKEIMDLYAAVIKRVNQTSVRLGWNIDTYPDETFVSAALERSEICVLREEGKIIAAAVVNHEVNPEYDRIDWKIKGPREKIATIHALGVLPQRQGMGKAAKLLSEIEEYCRKRGDIAIHLDVIDTNIPAYRLYTGNGYQEVGCIKMFYEVVGVREFWMMEKVLSETGTRDEL